MKRPILIIDDDSRNIFALSAVLKAKGFSTLAASGMEEACEQLRRHPDTAIILADMMMPDTDGYEAIPRLKQAVGLRHIPVIAVTAQAMAGDREKCLAAGADEYIPKPVDVDRLLRLLNEYLK
jgi:CheY-like chemotaxis protein